MKAAAALLLLVACAIGPASGADEQDADPLDAPLRQAARLLGQRPDADSLAAAAVLTFIKDRAGAEQLAARASAAGPKRPDLLWLHTQLCNDVPCDRNALLTQLRALDPENGLTLVSALAESGKAVDPTQADRQLDALAAAKRVDLYWNPLIAHLADAVVSTKKLTTTQSVVTVIGVLAALAIPPFQGTAVLCRGEELQREGRRARCQGVARVLQQGDTSIVEMVGVGMAKQLWPDNSPEVRAANEARRVFDYRSSLMGQESARVLADDDHARDYLEKLGRYRREQDMIVAELVAAGRNPNPPADWLPAPARNGTPGPAAR